MLPPKRRKELKKEALLQTVPSCRMRQDAHGAVQRGIQFWQQMPTPIAELIAPTLLNALTLESVAIATYPLVLTSHSLRNCSTPLVPGLKA